MKTRNDPRHLARIKTMQSLFSLSFQQNLQEMKKSKAFLDKNISPIIKRINKIDNVIEKSAPAFPVDKIAKVDLSILRLAIYELIISKKNPPKVIIDEAVELAKEFGGDTSSAFVNGVLGTVLANVKTYGSKSN